MHQAEQKCAVIITALIGMRIKALLQVKGVEQLLQELLELLKQKY